jgi:hypothetical protein
MQEVEHRRKARPGRDGELGRHEHVEALRSFDEVAEVGEVVHLRTGEQEMQAGMHRGAGHGATGGQIEIHAHRLDLVGQQAPQIRIGPPGLRGSGPGQRLQRLGCQQADQVGSGGDQLPAGVGPPAVGGEGERERPEPSRMEAGSERAAVGPPPVGCGTVAASRKFRNVHLSRLPGSRPRRRRP